ncbi:MAG: hypothetical protein IJT95_03630 [Abditibacteriota bacterium]|nr:hypothetical protein [Abditibacteriota bacterium]
MQERLHNASVIRQKLNSFKTEFRIEECKGQLRQPDKAFEPINFSEAFSQLRDIKTAFAENRPLEKQDNDSLWAEYIDCSNTVYELNKQTKELTDEEIQKITDKICGLLDALEKNHLQSRPKGGQIFWQDCEEIISAFREANNVLHFKQQEELWERYRRLRNEAGKRRREQRRKRIEGKANLINYIRNRIQVQEEYLAGISRDLDNYFEKAGSTVINLDSPKWVVHKTEKKLQVTRELGELRLRLSKLERDQ